MKFHWLRIGSGKGILGVLAVLCAFFSAVTMQEQPLTGESAAARMIQELPSQGQFMIAVGDQPEDRAWADLLTQKRPDIATKVVGDPKAVRLAFQDLTTKGTKLDAILCSATSAGWLVIQDAGADFPALGQPKVIVPRSERWPTFLKPDNLLNIANQIAVIAILAIGMTVVIITSGIDLSVGSLIALSAVTTSLLIRDYLGGVQASAVSMMLAALGGISLCGLIGLGSGWIVTRLRVPPFIVTLAVMLIASGLAYRLAENQSIYQVPESFVWLGRGSGFLGLPNAVLLMLGLYALAHGIMTQTRFGRHLYAVGGNLEAATLSGLPVRGVITAAYVISGLLAGLGGVVTASLLKSGSPTYGAMYELYVIAAVVVGGTRLSGGQGSMGGTLAGAFIIAVLQNGMNLTNVESNTQKIVLGLVILGAVTADRWRKR
ncbi:MAG: ABC transporter permease [Verrucomicrobiota bacterium]